MFLKSVKTPPRSTIELDQTTIRFAKASDFNFCSFIQTLWRHAYTRHKHFFMDSRQISFSKYEKI